MKKTSLSLGCALIATCMTTGAACAEMSDGYFDFADESRWIIRLRAIDVDPDVSSSVTGLNTKVKAKYDLMPELDFTYFFTENIAAEAILGTTNHEMSTTSGIDLGDVWVLPPTLSLQYHFNPHGQWRPYAGLSGGYMLYYGEDSGSVNNIKYEDGFSYGFQIGMDVGIDEHWAINADIKKLYHNTDVSINNGAIRADVDLDPWVFGAGVAYRF